jgi:hypothetical protein
MQQQRWIASTTQTYTQAAAAPELQSKDDACPVQLRHGAAAPWRKLLLLLYSLIGGYELSSRITEKLAERPTEQSDARTRSAGDKWLAHIGAVESGTADG